MSSSPPKVKICGLSTVATVEGAAAAGAEYAGFNFYPKSPRVIDLDTAASLRGHAGGMAKVALFVDAPDGLIGDVVEALAPDMLQLHGKETPERVVAVRDRFGLPVMKVVTISEPQDVDVADAYEDVADMLLFDAKPPKSMANALPGGNALAFDWALVAGRKATIPWMLAGGLTPENVAEAVAVTGAPIVDVSSGVETAPGEKSIALIEAFIKAAKGAG